MDQKFQVLSILFLIFTVIVTSLFVLRGPLSTYTRASNQVPSKEKSLLIAYPLVFKVGEKSKVDVFVTALDGAPIKGRPVTLASQLTQVETQDVTTDANGQATFSLIGTSPGTDEVGFLIEGETYPSTVQLTITE